MSAQVLAATGWGVACPVLVSLAIRLFGRPGSIRRASLYMRLVATLVGAGCIWLAYSALALAWSWQLLGKCFGALVVSTMLCAWLMRHRLRAHYLFAQRYWTSHEVIGGLKAIVRFYRSSAARFELKICMIDMQDKKPAELQVYLRGSEEPVWCHILEPDAVHQMQRGDLQVRIAREFGDSSLPDRNGPFTELIWEPGCHQPSVTFLQAAAQPQLVDA